MIVSEEEAA